MHALGLTTGGPLDPEAFRWTNRLLGNSASATAIEVSFGGLELEAQVDTHFCVCGADMDLSVDNQAKPLWASHAINAGSTIKLGYSSGACRSYLGVHGGFEVKPMFGSTSTVVRESLGGLSGNKLTAGDLLPCEVYRDPRRFYLPPEAQPHYSHDVTLRVIPGYQQRYFTRYQQQRFFGHSYTVSDRCDRMGYRLEGPAISCEIEGILSEGICLGAVQIPADGQPIVLMNDRQTIGGYPKIGSALSLDLARLAQLMPGSTVHFAPITPHAAHNALHLAEYRFRYQTVAETRQ